MARNLARPYFPLPPREYSPSYMAEIIRSFSVYLEQQGNPGVGRFTTITLTDLPTSSSGLESGALWNDSGTVKIVP